MLSSSTIDPEETQDRILSFRLEGLTGTRREADAHMNGLQVDGIDENIIE